MQSFDKEVLTKSHRIKDLIFHNEFNWLFKTKHVYYVCKCPRVGIFVNFISNVYKILITIYCLFFHICSQKLSILPQSAVFTKPIVILEIWVLLWKKSVVFRDIQIYFHIFRYSLPSSRRQSSLESVSTNDIKKSFPSRN